MSVIQNIRDKYAKVTVIAIALALLGFIAMDAFTGRNNMFGGGPSSTVGSVNGRKIDVKNFRQSLAEAENMMEQQRYPASPARTQQAMEMAWNQEVNKTLILEQAEKLGIRVSKKEMDYLLYVNPPQDLRQQFTDEAGNYNAEGLSARIREVRRGTNKEEKANINAFLDRLMLSRLEEKYNSFLSNSLNIPKWMVEKQTAEESQVAKISLVRKPYTDIPDSSVKVTDDEIMAYVNKNKTIYKQEESRSISFVAFSAAPSAADTLSTKQQLAALIPELDSTRDLKQFLAAEGVQNYYDGYIDSKVIQLNNKDSIFKIAPGRVYGPYLDGTSFTIAKLVGVRQIPDSVKVRHILIATMRQNQQTGQPEQFRDTLEAMAIADSVRRLYNSGVSFDTLVTRFSDDGGSKAKGGVYEFGSGTMAPEFNDYAFTKPVGSKDIVRTDFGYHFMEVLSQKGSTTGYNIAQISKPILTSAETDNKARNDASAFAADARDAKSFDETFEKKWKPLGYSKGLGLNIGRSSYSVNGLGFNREFVRKIYNAKRGEVLAPEQVEDKYVVAIVTGVYEKGTQDAATARLSVEPMLRNKKKAEIMIKQLGTVTTLEDAATKWGRQIEPVDSVRFAGQQPTGIGFEPKVIGAAFNAANRGKVVTEAIEGAQGVYVIRVENVAAVASTGGSVDDRRKQMIEQLKYSQPRSPLDFLRSASNIKDKRADHY